MRRYLVRAAVLALVVSFLGTAFVRAGFAQEESAGAVDFSTSKAWKKLDSDTQKAWQDAMAAKDPDRRFDCFVRVRAPADRGDKSFLISNGFVVRMFSGNTASGYMAAKDLPGVARLDFVDAVRLAKDPDPNVKKVDR